MDENAPRVAWGTTCVLSLALLGVSVLMAWYGGGPVGWVFLGLVLLVVGSGVVRLATTEFTPVGVSQLTSCGRFLLRWEDVRAVRYGPRGSVVLKGDHRRLVISLAFYRDYDAACRWLDEHLPERLTRQE